MADSKAMRKAQSAKISALVKEGYGQKQAVAISYAEKKKGGLKRLKQFSKK